jgi:transposase
MEKTLSSQATDWREGRRLRALELKERGWKQTEIADALGVTEGTVSQWMKRAREEGAEGLRHKPPPGATPRLSDDERAKLPESSWPREPRRMVLGESYGHVRG